MSQPDEASALLRVSKLSVSYQPRKPGGRSRGRSVLAVDDIDLTIGRGEIVGLVGESGCGKTSIALAVAGLIRVSAGEIWFGRTMMLDLNERGWRPYRRKIQLIFQDHLGAFDPLQTIGASLAEAIRMSSERAGDRERDRCIALLEMVGLNPGLNSRYPAELSAGQRQRAGIARALAVNPSLLVCDEIVSALDTAATQSILEILREMRDHLGISILFISHDLEVVRRIADRVLVMYGGKILEEGPTPSVLAYPKHPYTQRLKDSVLSVDPRQRQLERKAGSVNDDDARGSWG